MIGSWIVRFVAGFLLTAAVIMLAAWVALRALDEEEKRPTAPPYQNTPEEREKGLRGRAAELERLDRLKSSKR